jgi:ribosome maturation factor RimP
MRIADTGDRLAEELTEPVQALGLDLEAVEVKIAGKRRLLRIAVDKDGGVSLDDVADATREISRVLDERDLMGEHAYTLEVSSPGTERPLTLPRHWRRNVTRMVKVTTTDDETILGRITDSDEVGADLTVSGVPRRVEYTSVQKALVQIEFTKEA